ncbi:MAG: hypothetical protein JO246_01975 [Frankiaceae bacterium]|nr:hypothetical protein [Frankiaceae bacterium]MBV9872342.1 hypothetical protein [Frankiaceae bacterium]
MWPFRRRRRQEDYVGRHRPGSWAEIALPPALEGNRVDTGIDRPDETVTLAPAPAVVAPPLAPDAVGDVVSEAAAVVEREPAAAAPKVRLGFADGTSMVLNDGSDQVDAFQAVAARLLNGPR